MKLKIQNKIFQYLITTLFISVSLFAQITDFKKIPLPHMSVKESAILSIGSQELLLFYINNTQDSIFNVRSLDGGNNWQNESFIRAISLNQPQEKVFLNAIKTDQNRLILMWSVLRDSISFITSDDNGYNWSELKEIGAGHIPTYYKRAVEISIVKSESNKLFLGYSDDFYRYLWLKTSSDGGETWSELPVIIYSNNEKKYNLFIQAENDTTLFAYFIKNEPNSILYRTKSTNAGMNWSAPEMIFEFGVEVNSVKTISTADKKLWMVYQKKSSFKFNQKTYFGTINYESNNIYLRSSEDFGTSWSAETQITKYIGDDNFNNVSLHNGNPIISFSTQRFDNDYNLSYFLSGSTEEISTPPYLVFNFIQKVDTLKNKMIVDAIIIDDNEIQKVEIGLGDGTVSGELFDDGLHSDQLANDSLFSNIFELVRLDSYDEYLIETNKFKLPIDKNGSITGVNVSYFIPVSFIISDINNYIASSDFINGVGLNIQLGLYDGVGFLFSSGFALSGFDSDSLWSNGVFRSALIEDYISGPVGSNPNDIKNTIFVLKSSDPPFGNSWISWKNAVELGAEFFDGDKDGKYDPIDKNLNGMWDYNEDMPMILGDETVWCVFNDGVPQNERRFDVSPKSIEVAQSIFFSELPQFENIIFIRHKITNKASVNYDSVYFGFWSDADLGEIHSDDLVACDTFLNSGFVYNSGPDNSVPGEGYGINPPAFFTTLLQGPVIQTGLTSDTAFVKLGSILGEKIITSSKNLDPSAFMSFMGGNPELGDPNTPIELRNYIKGKTKFGNAVNPCNWPYGVVKGGINCSDLNNNFWYSGDPVTQVGWIYTVPNDIRNLLSTGPFKLNVNEPVEILSAFVLGRGSDELNSVTVARENVQRAIQEYQSNFSSLAYNPGEPNFVIDNYELFQNYPNPFNPATTIRYDVLEDGIVTLKVYDILGQEVRTLVNEFKPARRYEVDFSSKGLASGVYIYRLQVNGFDQSKKMIILK